jgi:hypothetical protein
MDDHHQDLGLERRAHSPPPGLLVCHGHDYVVSNVVVFHLGSMLTFIISIIIPWLCIREVPVDVELVRLGLSHRTGLIFNWYQNSRRPK